MSAPTTRPVRVSDTCRAECAAIRPADTTAEWTALVAAMPDVQLARAVDRLEALPGGEFRRIACAEFDRRARLALVASMCPSTYWTATNGSNR
ncbi:hypothetical protein [Micromonospora sp. C41]|uniref:hypothetical protein n=1 Tax=Micromonospora sp. C41 TaxID=2824878 RepID=UPI001B379407|nr:hypothetical protein [Micromonospora sp. C41]MBQ1064516.1 hypothetical protein [Micromonospora sp. C41]